MFDEPWPLAFQFQETKLSPLDEFQPLSPVVKVKPSESKEVIIPCVPAAEVWLGDNWAELLELTHLTLSTALWWSA